VPDRIVVTGGAGRIGAYVVAELQDDYELIVFDHVLPATRHRARYRLGNHEDLGEVIDACAGAAAILHLSAIPAPRTHPDQTVFRTNVMGTFTVHQAAALLGIGTVVSTSSQSAFGWAWGSRDFLPHYLPIDEAHPDEPDDAYGLSKVVGEQIAHTFHRTTGMRTLVLRPPMVTFPERYDQLRQRIAAGTMTWRDAIFTYLDVRDLATAFRAALERTEVVDEVFNVAASDSLATEPLCDLLPRLDPRLAELARPLTGTQPMVSNAKIRRLLGWEPRYSWRTDTG
jgi:nucleoside-diphosphate-sugar epimerase